MTRVELNNLAKNKYCDDEIQVWIASHAHVQARYYLADNPSVCEPAINELLCGRSRIIKGLLVGQGAVEDADTIRDIYSQLRFKVDQWRICNFFIRNYWGRHYHTHTPSDVLDKIHEDYLEVHDEKAYRYYRRNLQKNMALHPNCSLKLAIRLSQDEDSEVSKAGFDALVRINAQKD
jgi:hypothetical protein